MNQFQKQVEAISANIKPRWPSHIRIVHLSEEVGELADAYLAYAGHKDSGCEKVELEEALGGIFFDLFCLCSDFEIDVNEMLSREIEKFWKYASKEK